MKIFTKIKWYYIGIFLLISSCSDYLDVVPPEQEQLKDATKDYNTTLGFLYSCYRGITNPIQYGKTEAASDEWVLPPLWAGDHPAVKMTYGLDSPSNFLEWRWGSDYYRFIGQCHLFLKELPNAKGVTEEQKQEWAAEANFLIAYYHMQVLFLYGPCPINDQYINSDAPASLYPGRSHFDYVVDWIVKKYDESAKYLPASRADEKWGRITSTIAKAMKARLLLYAASPLWNGKFPYPQWKNVNFETPGYGKDLVSLTYDKAKWERARKACQEALDFATSQGGHSLYSDEEYYDRQQLDLPYVPGIDKNTAEGKAFLKKVMLMRYLVTTRSTEGNKEIIWGLADQGDNNMVFGSIPHAILKRADGSYVSLWSGVSPILNTSISYFYTQKGKRPKDDSSYFKESEWYQSANIKDRDGIINFNVGREPRFYAWFAFDDGDYGSKLANGKPLRLQLRNPNAQGFNQEQFNRDNNVTGYFSQKYVQPNLAYNTVGSSNYENKPRPLIRLAELYLNLAECEAELGNTMNAINNLNIIRNRAGVPNLEVGDLSIRSIVEWVRNERFIELWGEGHRYYDIRRWMIASETMGAGMRLGLNAYGKKAPTFKEFNTVKPVEQPFIWNNRMYLMPVFLIEVYKNPQLVQAPGY